MELGKPNISFHCLFIHRNRHKSNFMYQIIGKRWHKKWMFNSNECNRIWKKILYDFFLKDSNLIFYFVLYYYSFILERIVFKTWQLLKNMKIIIGAVWVGTFTYGSRGGKPSRRLSDPTHRSLLICKKTYWGWRLPSAVRLKEKVIWL